ncbi:hypothetical protein D3C72_1509880 [compost metagenome]
MLVQLIQPRISEDRQRTEDHHGAYRHRHLVGVGFQHRLSRHHGRRAANAAAGADQHRGLAVDAEHFFTQPAGEQESGAQGQCINDDAGGAYVSNLLKRQAKTVKDNAQTQ